MTMTGLSSWTCPSTRLRAWWHLLIAAGPTRPTTPHSMVWWWHFVRLRWPRSWARPSFWIGKVAEVLDRSTLASEAIAADEGTDRQCYINCYLTELLYPEARLERWNGLGSSPMHWQQEFVRLPDLRESFFDRSTFHGADSISAAGPSSKSDQMDTYSSDGGRFLNEDRCESSWCSA